MINFIYAFLGFSFGYSLFEKLKDKKSYLIFLDAHIGITKMSTVFFYFLIFVNLTTTLVNFTFIINNCLFHIQFENNLIFYTNATAILILLVGQRIANDYQGAANLGIYFLINIAGYLIQNII